MSRHVFPVSKETQGRERIQRLREEMDKVEIPTPAEAPDPALTLEALVEAKLKEQLRSLDPKEVGWGVVNAIKFLAVRAKLPVAFGSELDDPTGGA